MARIKEVKALEILDSRGDPTVQAIITSSKGKTKAAVPSGASTGIHEACELRDKGKRFNGKGVLKAVNNINTKIAKALKGKNPKKQEKIDEIMLRLDGTASKFHLGANAILAVSMAVARQGAIIKKKELYQYIASLSKNKEFSLPIPQMNILDGGAHIGAKNDVQEYLIIPHKFSSFSESLRAGAETYQLIKNKIKKRYGYKAVSVTAEGGFIAPMRGVEKRLDFLQNSIEESGYKNKISLALDAAASEFYNNKKRGYTISNKSMDSGKLIDFYKSLTKKYKIVSIEDGLAQDDWEGWIQLTEELGKKIQIIGDDLLVTNPIRISHAIKKQAANALLLKPNQIGTVTESIESASLCKTANWNIIVSHRSGETEDPFIADFAVGIGANQAKFGAPARSDRTSKYNRLLEIENLLGKKAKLAKLK